MRRIKRTDFDAFMRSIRFKVISEHGNLMESNLYDMWNMSLMHSDVNHLRFNNIEFNVDFTETNKKDKIWNYGILSWRERFLRRLRLIALAFGGLE